MDPSSPQNNAEPNQDIFALVSEFFDRRQAGEELTPERFADENPELADELRPYLKGLALFDQARSLASHASVAEVPAGPADLPAVEGYDLIEEIGRGGMGVVYKALQAATNRIVALKVMLAGPFASPSGRRRFEREVELAARLRHSSIVSVLEAGHVAEQPYYAMEYVAGVRLDRYLAAAQPELRTTLSLFVQVCEAVEYAHGHGVIHRDLKPANVLIDDEGHPHILDFGLAKATDQTDSEEAVAESLSQTGQVLGTLFYLSPEQAAGATEEIDARTDVYALGIVLFEALTGSLPFDTTGRPSQVIQRILETPPSRPSSLSNRVDSELETIILKALEKEKERRYQSAKDLAEDVRRYLAGDPILAKRPSSLYFLRKKLWKHRLATALGTAAIVALVVVFIGLLAESRSRQRELADARRAAVRVQQELEKQGPIPPFGPAQALFERHPELPEAALVQAHALRARSELQYMSIPFLQELLRADPSRWACRALLAEFWQAAGDAERAGVLHAQAERDAPDTAEAWYLRSFATLELGRALRCAEQAVQRQPSHALAWERLTYLRLQTGDLDGALQGADKLIELGENANEWSLFKGVVLVKQGKFREAIQEYARLCESGYVHLPHAYRRVKEYEKAVDEYTRLVQRGGESAGAVWHFYQRATPLWILGRREEALEDYRRVRILLGRPFYSDARQYLILHELDRQDDAEEVLKAALRDVKDDWLRQIFRCLAGQLTPDELVANGAARNNLEQLCEAYYYAGEVCLLTGDRDQARKWFEECVQTGLEFDPDATAETPMNEFELAQWRLESLLPRAP